MKRGNKNNKKESKVKFTRGQKTETKENKGFVRGNKNAPEMPNKHLGGFLPFPPKNCQKKEHITLCYGILWIDLNVCHNCGIIKDCTTRKEHLQKLKEQRKLHFEGKGI